LLTPLMLAPGVGLGGVSVDVFGHGIAGAEEVAWLAFAVLCLAGPARAWRGVIRAARSGVRITNLWRSYRYSWAEVTDIHYAESGWTQGGKPIEWVHLFQDGVRHGVESSFPRGYGATGGALERARDALLSRREAALNSRQNGEGTPPAAQP
jgi:hypothetical protein